MEMNRNLGKKVKKIILCAVCYAFLLLCCGRLSHTEAQAAVSLETVVTDDEMAANTVTAQSSLKSNTIKVSARDLEYIPFTIESGKRYVSITFTAHLCQDQERVVSSKWKIRIEDEDGNVVEEDVAKIKNFKKNETWFASYYSSEKLSAGKYFYVIENCTRSKTKYTYKIEEFKKISTNAAVPKTISITENKYKTVTFEKNSNAGFLVKNLKSSNPGVITIRNYKKIGRYIIVANKPGTTKLTFVLANGKKYTTKVTVKQRNYKTPSFGALVTEYNTRGNYFVVKIRNYANKNLYISSGIKAQDIDYTSYDRTVYLKSSVTIPPNKTKNVKFYVSGSTTWPDYQDFTIFYKFKYRNVTYEGHVWSYESVYKRNGKWYYTYWDSDEEKFLNLF